MEVLKMSEVQLEAEIEKTKSLLAQKRNELKGYLESG